MYTVQYVYLQGGAWGGGEQKGQPLATLQHLFRWRHFALGSIIEHILCKLPKFHRAVHNGEYLLMRQLKQNKPPLRKFYFTRAQQIYCSSVIKDCRHWTCSSSTFSAHENPSIPHSLSYAKGTVSRDGFGFWWHAWWLVLGLNRGWGHFLGASIIL